MYPNKKNHNRLLIQNMFYRDDLLKKTYFKQELIVYDNDIFEDDEWRTRSIDPWFIIITN